MAHDWKALAPHRPLSVEEVRAGEFYVPRLGVGAHTIGALFDAGSEQPTAIFGPAGSGKSTELAVLAETRESKWIGPLCRLDKVLRYDQAVSVDEVLEAIAIVVTQAALQQFKLKLSALVLGYADVQRASKGPIRFKEISGFDLLLATVREIRRRSLQGVVALLVDGLEKAETGLAIQVLAQLERLRDEARIVVVVPTSVATGPGAAALHDYRLVSLGPVIVSKIGNVSAEAAETGISFLMAIALRRLGLSTAGELEPLLRAAARASGGLIRTFLQLLHSAAIYAAMRGGSDPSIDDLKTAAADQTSFLLRLLKEGDAAALKKAHGTDGSEVEIDRRVRFLANGLLLEYETPHGLVVQVPPLLSQAVDAPSAGDWVNAR